MNSPGPGGKPLAAGEPAGCSVLGPVGIRKFVPQEAHVQHLGRMGSTQAHCWVTSARASQGLTAHTPFSRPRTSESQKNWAEGREFGSAFPELHRWPDSAGAASPEPPLSLQALLWLLRLPRRAGRISPGTWPQGLQGPQLQRGSPTPGSPSILSSFALCLERGSPGCEAPGGSGSRRGPHMGPDSKCKHLCHRFLSPVSWEFSTFQDTAYTFCNKTALACLTLLAVPRRLWIYKCDGRIQ
ncbi:uncharacterized protein LOC110346200 [Heterocephalus glaber]|uniref:Uncharacterized protein LOC110346200 n=1 Tax=Heterocephalus glaber TaxID=10181 RepID=A0AAX6S2B7_HETGA|nr:uncharacterized protein LOC110346200 [Heterocephalus glaber]